jgi:hypothetical protein
LLVISTFPYALQSFGSVGLLANMQYDFNDRFDGSAISSNATNGSPSDGNSKLR